MIESPQNETFRRYRSLTSSRGLKDEGLFLLSGQKLVHEFLDKPTLTVRAEIRLSGHAKLCSAAEQVTLTKALFDELDVLGTGYNLLVLEQPTLPLLRAEELVDYVPTGIEVVSPVGDPSNMGALVRSCEAFGIRRIILSQEAAHPFLPKSVKASAGSVLRVPFCRGPELKYFPKTCIALDLYGTSLDDFEWPRHGLLIVGEEGQGLRGQEFDQRICIPTSGVESLNAVVAASIALSRVPKPSRT